MQKGPIRLKAEDLFGDFSNLDNLQDANVGYEFHWRWPKHIGTGYLSMFKFRPGLMLGTGSYHLSKETEVDFALENPFFVLAFNVSKSDEEKGGGSQGSDWSYEQGKGAFFYQPEWKGTVKLPVCSHVGTVSIYITPESLKTFLGPSRQASLLRSHPVLKGNSKQFYSQPLEMASNAHTTVSQILNCPYQGSMSRLYLEGKTLELLTYSLSQFYSPEALWKKNDNVSDQRVKQIHLAKRLIGKDLQNPPRLQELAQAVGLSHAKLNQCFREMFGTTTFGYLRELRLNRAKTLLDNGTMNVTEVANEVGYTNLSHFAKSFKDHHGTSPRAYMRKAGSK